MAKSTAISSPITAVTVGTAAHTANVKVTLVDADETTGCNSASFGLIRTTWANVWVYIKSKADAIYGVNASGFNGNLTTSDNTVQKVAQKLDVIVLSSGGSVSLSRFYMRR